MGASGKPSPRKAGSGKAGAGKAGAGTSGAGKAGPGKAGAGKAGAGTTGPGTTGSGGASGAPPQRRRSAAPTSLARTRDESARPHRSAVEALLAPAPAGPAAPRPAIPGPEVEQAGRAVADALLQASQRAAAVVEDRATVPPERPGDATPAVTAEVPLDPVTGLPPVQDVALGAATLVAEHLWAAAARLLAVGTGAVGRSVGFLRAVSPQLAVQQADARLLALAARGRHIRVERTEALTANLTTAITTAATSEAVRQLAVAAIEEATDDVLAVVLPALLESITDAETQDKLDELMAGLLMRQLPAALEVVADAETRGTLDELMARLLLRQLPAALEKTIPQVMLRTATRPAAGLMPFLGGVLPR